MRRRSSSAEALDALLTDARRGVLPDTRPSGHTFGEACAEFERYVQVEKGAKPSTLIGYRAVNRLLVAEFGDGTPVEKVTAERIDAYRARLLAEGKLAPRSVQKRVTQLHGIFRRAAKLRWLAANPVEHVERVRVKASGDFNVLTPAELEAVARAAASDDDAALIGVAAYTGLRMGELRALRWSDVAFELATIHVRRNLTQGGYCPPKSNQVRSVPLIDQAAAALDALSRREHYTGPDDLVFGSALGTPRDEGEIRDAFYAALKAAGLGHLRTQDTPFRFHDLRHTFGTLAVQVWPLTDVQAYMGHADIQTTMRYVHHVPKGDAAAKLGAAVAAALGAETLSPTLSRTDENGTQHGDTKSSVYADSELADAA